MLISNRQKETASSVCKLSTVNNNDMRCGIAVYWQIKRIAVEDRDDPDKFDKMIRAIRQRKSVPGYSTVLWDVRTSDVQQ